MERLRESFGNLADSIGVDVFTDSLKKNHITLTLCVKQDHIVDERTSPSLSIENGLSEIKALLSNILQKEK